MNEFTIVPGEDITIDFVLPISQFKLIFKNHNNLVIKTYTQVDFTKENDYYTKEINTSFLDPYNTYEVQLYSFEPVLDDTSMRYIRSWFISTKDKWEE